MKCKKCGQTIPMEVMRGASFKCPSCGMMYKRKTPSPNTEKPVQQKSSKKRSKTGKLTFLHRKFLKLPVWAWLAILIVCLIAGTSTEDGKNDTTIQSNQITPTVATISNTLEATTVETPQAHLYDKAEVHDILNGYRTEKIGEYSVIKADSTKVTLEALTDWYFNYVEVNDFNWCIILYTDKNEEMGVWGMKDLVQKDIAIKKDEYGDYSAGSPNPAIMYYPTENGTLEDVAGTEEQKEWRTRYNENEATVIAYLENALVDYNIRRINLTYWINEPDLYDAMFDITVSDNSKDTLKNIVRTIQERTAEYQFTYAVSVYDGDNNLLWILTWSSQESSINIVADGNHTNYPTIGEFFAS